MFVQELPRDPYEICVGAGGGLTGIQEPAKRHRFAGQIEGSVQREINRHHQEARNVLHIHHLYRIVSITRRNMIAALLRAQQPGKQVRSIVTTALDWSGTHNGQPSASDLLMKSPLAFGLAAVVRASCAVPWF